MMKQELSSITGVFLSLLTLASSVTAMYTTKANNYDTCCPASYRVDCGYFGIDEEGCVGMGCCWDPLQSGQSGPYCYDKNCRNPSLETCSASEHRVECGHHDMDQTQCEERDCCWDETSNSPSCFFKNEGGEDHNRCCPKGNRLECGYYGIGEMECVKQGCCWGALNGKNSEPTCFRPNCEQPEGDFCSIEDDREDCGYYGIDEDTCENIGCCWSPVETDSDEPWCFYKNGFAGECCDAESGRAECGYKGIDEEECEAKGCCYSPLEEDSVEPWCFYKNSDECTAEEKSQGTESTGTTEVESETATSVPLESGSVTVAPSESESVPTVPSQSETATASPSESAIEPTASSEGESGTLVPSESVTPPATSPEGGGEEPMVSTAPSVAAEEVVPEPISGEEMEAPPLAATESEIQITKRAYLPQSLEEKFKSRPSKAMSVEEKAKPRSSETASLEEKTKSRSSETMSVKEKSSKHSKHHTLEGKPVESTAFEAPKGTYISEPCTRWTDRQFPREILVPRGVSTPHGIQDDCQGPIWNRNDDETIIYKTVSEDSSKKHGKKSKTKTETIYMISRGKTLDSNSVIDSILSD